MTTPHRTTKRRAKSIATPNIVVPKPSVRSLECQFHHYQQPIRSQTCFNFCSTNFLRKRVLRRSVTLLFPAFEKSLARLQGGFWILDTSVWFSLSGTALLTVATIRSALASMNAVPQSGDASTKVKSIWDHGGPTEPSEAAGSASESDSEPTADFPLSKNPHDHADPETTTVPKHAVVPPPADGKIDRPTYDSIKSSPSALPTGAEGSAAWPVVAGGSTASTLEPSDVAAAGASNRGLGDASPYTSDPIVPAIYPDPRAQDHQGPSVIEVTRPDAPTNSEPLNPDVCGAPIEPIGTGSEEHFETGRKPVHNESSAPTASTEFRGNYFVIRGLRTGAK